MEQTDFRERVFSFFLPPEAAVLRRCAAGVRDLGEVCVYAGKAVVFFCENGARFCRKNGTLSDHPAQDCLRLDAEEMLRLLARAAEYSLFRKKEELGAGFLTVGGCRIAVCGAASDARIGAGGITSLHFRIPLISPPMPPEEVCGCLDAGSLLIAGPPGCGKTTMLKSCIRRLSGAGGGFKRVAVIDEREEFSAFVEGSPGCVTCDVIGCVPKGEAIERAVRLLNPEWIVCDELGSGAETAAVCRALNTGVRFLASIHAGTPEELVRRTQYRQLRQAGVFERVVFLAAGRPGRVDRILKGPAAEAFRKGEERVADARDRTSERGAFSAVAEPYGRGAAQVRGA
ncbi:MAG: Flp pilus assembly complex ATPase component TadA [Clostridia bacterium]|nr:Flp pilus assembly complex ATPase component TadA [Clostridia bacterium]MBR0509300.1 Flp pilus assembly complex ATPase component TadA [Clostridia bacterium]MBR0537665.1 Flp pilus assembly complex ATPase component TadA [Clostridia bacterium]